MDIATYQQHILVTTSVQRHGWHNVMDSKVTPCGMYIKTRKAAKK